jgi:hypothetical protein
VTVKNVSNLGMVLDPATVKTEHSKEDADYEGVRVRFVAIAFTPEFTSWRRPWRSGPPSERSSRTPSARDAR